MKLSAKSRYASRILLDLAQHTTDGPQSVNDIAKRTGISVPFIEQIIKPLKRAAMITSKRGAAGGHLLDRPANTITLGDIIRVTEESVDLAACLSDPARCERIDSCLTRVAWQRATDALFRELDTISLADLAAGTAHCCPRGQAYYERKS